MIVCVRMYNNYDQLAAAIPIPHSYELEVAIARRTQEVVNYI